MKFDFESFSPAGYAAQSAKAGEKAPVITREFTSSEDGDLFISRLEGIPNDILIKIGSPILPSQIDRMLVIINRDGTGTVYINEFDIITRVRSKADSIQKGDMVYDDDIADVESLSFGEILLQKDQAIVFIFSWGWRKGLFFDFSPLIGIERDYDLEALLGYYLSYLSHQYLHKLEREEWDALLNQQWFPFITLRKSTLKKMVRYLRGGHDIDDLLNEIALEVSSLLPKRLDVWAKDTYIAPHIELIRTAADRYIEQDYISANSILYPRIEGVIRTFFELEGLDKKASSTNMLEAIEKVTSSTSLLLPLYFKKFLKDVYFAKFDGNYSDKVSRHTIAHGVAAPEAFSEKSATLGFLILDQLFYLLKPR